MRLAYIKRFGDRARTPSNVSLSKIGMNVYCLHIFDMPPTTKVFVETLTLDRVAVLDVQGAGLFHIRTYNLRDGFHPGSDLRVRIYDALQTTAAASTVEIDGNLQPDQELLVQAHGSSFRYPQIERKDGRVRVTPLITRTPPTPTESNIEVAIVQTLGPLRSR